MCSAGCVAVACGGGRGVQSALEVDPEILTMSAEEVQSRTRMLDREVQIMETDANRLRFELERMKAQLEDNVAKVKRNKALPYLVSTVVELLDVDPEEMEEEDGANQDLDSQRKGKCAVIKTSTRQTVFLPIAGLVPPANGATAPRFRGPPRRLRGPVFGSARQSRSR